MAIRMVVGEPPVAASPEGREREKYQSGEADIEASQFTGRHDEPWLNVVDYCEPGSMPALEYALAHPALAARFRGRVLDCGAGTCWATARLSRLTQVDEVIALDMSERFLATVGARVIAACGGQESKITFAASSFNSIPFPDGYFQCVVMIAALHHSVTPLRSLLEIRRVLAPDGALLLIEMATGLRHIGKARRQALAATRASRATELCYTHAELAYMLAHAGFRGIRFHMVDALTRNPAVVALRRCLRPTGLEPVFFNNLAVIAAEP